ncbi:helix-turn-helix domain-containing protein [Halosimplex aquaticum]
MPNEIHNQDLAELIEGDEDYRKEFKSAEVLREPSDKHRRKIAREMVGFANRQGGKLIFGVDDETREVEELSLDDERSLKTISEVAHDRCEPKIEFTREFYGSDLGDVDNGNVYVVDISQRRGPPMQLWKLLGKT